MATCPIIFRESFLNNKLFIALGSISGLTLLIVHSTLETLTTLPIGACVWHYIHLNQRSMDKNLFVILMTGIWRLGGTAKSLDPVHRAESPDSSEQKA